MINQDKWINSIPKINNKFDENIKQLDSNRWVNTISKKTTYGPKNSYGSVKKYSLTAILFVSGLLLVSAVKNETRNLQKEIDNLEASIDVKKFNLKQAILDNEVITAPENIFRLAKEYLNTNLVSYKRSQIKQLSGESKNFTQVKKEKINKEKTKNLTASIKKQVVKKIEKRKTEIRKLQALYHNPKAIPKEIKTQVAVQIEEKKNEIRNIYSAPKDIFTLEKVGRWSVVQVVKLFLGMPIIPGR